jgi:hypothetical protein
MAKQNETAAKLPEIPEELFAVGNAVVVAPNGDRITLAGELTPEQRVALGESKLRGLITGGHLQTAEQLEAAEKLRDRLAENREANKHHINPNFGTPSMTPEAMAAASGEPLEAGVLSAADAALPARTAGGRKSAADHPVEDLDVDPRVHAALRAANLTNVQQVLEYGRANDGLQTIEGVGEASERQIQEAIDALRKS